MPDSDDFSLFNNLRGLISLVDQLRDIGVSDYISLPRIAVLGTQSAGKSSLLESVIGYDFLPRGGGVVTRRPLELRMVREKMIAKPYGVFKGFADKIEDFDKIRYSQKPINLYSKNIYRKTIEMLTDKVAGGNKGIVDDPIVLTVYSPDCPDLTIIDLPGICRNPTGDQPKNIDQITINMVTKYCRDERTVILAVVPANQDMATSDSLQIARQLDPEGKRTLGVVTKIDIMDKGTDARQMLSNEEIPLALGYVGVKGRSQQDINDKMKVAEA
jgi:GTPase Era involved in 16S rRNA processing